jgi:hypothetical protein
MNAVVAILMAGDLIAAIARARRTAWVTANQRVREADRWLAYVRQYGTPEQVQAAEELLDAWRDYRDSL